MTDLYCRDGQTPLSAVLRATEGRRAMLRHDTCGAHTLEPALAMARVEQELGVQATYFIWHDLPGFGGTRFMADVAAIRACGHRIGLHYDVVPGWLSRRVDPFDALRRALDTLRKSGPVAWLAAHGSPQVYSAHYLPYEVFEEFDPTANVGMGATWLPKFSMASLVCEEVYLDLGYDAALSDSRGMWTGWHGLTPKPFERIPAEQNVGLKVIENPEAKAIMCLLHPCHWEVG